jgi:hypothetical protein
MGLDFDLETGPDFDLETGPDFDLETGPESGPETGFASHGWLRFFQRFVLFAKDDR